MMKKKCFKQYERLKTRKEILETFHQGIRFYIEGLKMVVLKKTSYKKSTKIGISVPKKNIKKSVDRNQIKRRLRDAYRMHKYILYNFEKKYAIFFIWIKKEIPDYKIIEDLVKKHLNSLVRETR